MNKQKSWKAVYFPERRGYHFIVETVKGRQIGDVDYGDLNDARRKALEYTNRTKHDALIYKSVGYTTPRRK